VALCSRGPWRSRRWPDALELPGYEPQLYGAGFERADSVEGLRWELEHMLAALDKPVLPYNEEER
jgi:hypothetical protein